MTRSKKIRVAIAGVLLVVIHGGLISLGGVWRILGIADLAVGVFIILAMRDFKKLDKSE